MSATRLPVIANNRLIESKAPDTPDEDSALRAGIRATGISSGSLAKLIGVNKSTVTRFVSGKHGVRLLGEPRTKLSNLLSVTIDARLKRETDTSSAAAAASTPKGKPHPWIYSTSSLLTCVQT